MMNSSTGCMVWSWEGCLTQSLNHHPPLPRCPRPPRLPQRHQRLSALCLRLPGMTAIMNSSTGCMVWSWEGCPTKPLRHLRPPPPCLRPPRLPKRHQRLSALHLRLPGMRAMMNSFTVCMVWSWESCPTKPLRHLRPPPRCLRPPRLPQFHQRLPALRQYLQEMRAMVNSSTECMVWSWEGCLTQSLRHLIPPS